MNQILEMLAGGDLRSDGMANQVVDLVLQNSHLFDELAEGLKDDDEVVRGRVADALEKLSRSRPDLLLGHLPIILGAAMSDEVPMVRWHLAMILGNLTTFENIIDQIYPVLLNLLQDESVFVKSWTIVSLCILCRIHPHKSEKVVQEIAPLRYVASAAIRSKAVKAVNLLMSDEVQFPKGWIKSEHLAFLQG